MMLGSKPPHPLQRTVGLPDPLTSSVRVMPDPEDSHHLQEEADNVTSCRQCGPDRLHTTDSVSSHCDQKDTPTHNVPVDPLPDHSSREISQEAGASPPGAEECVGGVPPQTHTTDLSSPLPPPTAGTENISTALHTLKSELIAMREQDLQLLKQLIHINDNIRRLKRARWLQRGGRTVSCGILGARTPAALPPGSGQGAPGSGDRVSMLLRQRSEPGLLGVPYRKVSALTSTSSFETIADEEEVDSVYGSSSELPSDSSSTAPSSPFSPCRRSAPTTPLTRSPSAYTSLTFTQEELWRGESSYGEILKRNVRLWKWSVARERDCGIVDGHPCVL